MHVDSSTTFLIGKYYLKETKWYIYIIKIEVRVYISRNVNPFPFLGSKLVLFGVSLTQFMINADNTAHVFPWELAVTVCLTAVKVHGCSSGCSWDQM